MVDNKTPPLLGTEKVLPRCVVCGKPISDLKLPGMCECAVKAMGAGK